MGGAAGRGASGSGWRVAGRACWPRARAGALARYWKGALAESSCGRVGRGTSVWPLGLFQKFDATILDVVQGAGDLQAQFLFVLNLQAALDDLSPDFRVAVVLCDVVGMTYDEIAETLGVKMGTVRSRIHRGRSQLKSSLEKAARTNDEARVLLRTR